MLLVGVSGLRAAEAYVYLDTTDGCLYFCYDNNRASRNFTTYDLNTGNYNPAWWGIADQVKTAYFTTGFANYTPTTCWMWFYKMTNLTNVAYITRLNTANVTSMSCMFRGCSSLTSLNVSNFNTANITSMAYMFSGCSKLSSLNLSNFTIPANTSGMMNGCTSLRSLTVPSSGNTLSSDACEGVGTKAAPSTLVYPEGFKPEKTSMGKGWYMWKGGYFKETGGIRGDANGDGEVSLIDVMITVEYYLGNNPQDFIFTNAEMDDDDEISLSDLLGIVDIILNQ